MRPSFVPNLLRENGLAWTLNFLARRPLRNGLARTERRLGHLEVEEAKPGMNSRPSNRAKWDDRDWGDDGEEWTPAPEWKQALVDHVLRPNVPPGSVVLEIGPGTGRWTEHILPLAERIVLVDISQTALDKLVLRFSHLAKLVAHRVDRPELGFLDRASVDLVWSFDAFLHIAPSDIRSYVHEIARVLKPGGRALVHHTATETDSLGRWRSGLSAEVFARMLGQTGLVLERRIDAWGPACEFGFGGANCTISVFGPGETPTR